MDLSSADVGALSSVDALAGFLTRLGYPTGCRRELTASGLDLKGETAQAIRSMELLAEDDEQLLRVVFARLRSVTAKARTDLARNLGRRNTDHLLILASDFDTIEFVLIDKRIREKPGPVGTARPQIIPLPLSVPRKAKTLVHRRILRRLTWTGQDGLDQFEKLKSVFEAAHFTGQYFQNRALFADHYLEHRLPDDPTWQDNPSAAFTQAKAILRDARKRWTGKDEQVVRDELYGPVWKLLGFKSKINKAADSDHLEPDYALSDGDGGKRTVAFVYRWDRWLDGPDLSDPETPDENPGAGVVTALTRGDAKWVIVTNGRLWRLYSAEAHSRSLGTDSTISCINDPELEVVISAWAGLPNAIKAGILAMVRATQEQGWALTDNQLWWVTGAYSSGSDRHLGQQTYNSRTAMVVELP